MFEMMMNQHIFIDSNLFSWFADNFIFIST